MWVGVRVVAYSLTPPSNPQAAASSELLQFFFFFFFFNETVTFIDAGDVMGGKDRDTALSKGHFREVQGNKVFIISFERRIHRLLPLQRHTTVIFGIERDVSSYDSDASGSDWLDTPSRT